MPDQSLEELVGGIVVAQGNLFIRELLRDKGLPVSGTKAEFADRLGGAVGSGALTLEEIDDWLHRVEGWGNFYIYPFRVPNELAADGRWKPAEARRRIGTVAAHDRRRPPIGQSRRSVRAR